MKKILALIFLLAFCASAQEAVEDSSVIRIEHKSSLMKVVSWPFVNIIQPVAGMLLYPVVPPLLYVSRENIIEKVDDIITFGENKQIRLYPIINVKQGNQAVLGLAYWHSDLFLDNDRLFISPKLYLNADWEVVMRYKKSKIYGSSFYWGLDASYKESGEDIFRSMEKITYYYADSSIYLEPYTGFNVIGNWDLEFGLGLHFYRFDFPHITKDSIDVESEEVLNRGFYKNYEAYPLTISILHNSLDAPYAPTKGRKFSLSYTYVPVSGYNSSKDHNYHVVESRLVNYNLLGTKSYAMTVAESNANRERLKNLSFSDAIEILNPINVKEEILDRRVLVTQLKMRYMIEENDGKAPFTAMGKLGGNFPLRAYETGYFTGPLVAGISNEYRWPIDRYADALIFNEYGIYGKDFSNLSLSNLKNSYGLGFRVRTPRFFIARFVLAFHGLEGISVTMTTKPDYN